MEGVTEHGIRLPWVLLEIDSSLFPFSPTDLVVLGKIFLDVRDV